MVAPADSLFKKLKAHLWHSRQGLLFRVKPWVGLFAPPIVIYSMGKVGSTTIQATLEQLCLPNPIFHVHFLAWDYLEEIEAYRRSFRQEPVAHLEAGKALRFFADRTWGRVRWKLITLVREPVGREISDLFENLRTFPQFRELSGEALAEAASAHLREFFNHFNEAEDYACNWFDRELKQVFGFDIYAAPFAPHQGYAICRAENADILLIRLEDLSRVGAQALNEFLGLEQVTLVNANQGQQKAYQQVYRQVTGKIRFSANTLEAVYNSRYARKFYSAVEIERFKQRWQISG